MRGKRYEVPVMIGNTVTNGLLDTGSECSTVSEAFYEEHLSEFKLNSINDFLTVQAANGESVAFSGYIVVPVRLEVMNTDISWGHHVIMLVVKDTEFNQEVPVIIGTNILDLVFSEIVEQKGSNFMQKYDIPVPWRVTYKTIRGMKKYKLSTKVVRSCSKQNVKIEAQQTMLLWGKVKAPPGGCHGQEIALTVQSSKLEKGLVVKNNVVQLEKTGSHDQWVRVPIEIQNESNRCITVKPKDELGRLECVKITHMTENLPEIHPEISHVDLYNLEGLDDSQREKARTMLAKWQHVTSLHEHDEGLCTKQRHRIILTDNTPFKEKFRHIPPGMFEELRDYISGMLDSGVIRPSTSPWASAVIPIRKKSGELRIVGDMRALNSRTVKDAYPLPRIEETLDMLKGAEWYSTLDLKSGYWQMEIEECDREKTAFTLGPLGLYEYNRLVMGLCGAPASFQRMMNEVLEGLTFKECMVYLDDIAIFASNFEEMLERLDRVFARLAENGLKVKPAKCKLFKKEIRYLGYLVSSQGVQPEPDKIEAVQSWPVPTDVSALRRFLGFTGYYRRFVQGYAQICAPLYKLLCGQPFKKKKLEK